MTTRAAWLQSGSEAPSVLKANMKFVCGNFILLKTDTFSFFQYFTSVDYFQVQQILDIWNSGQGVVCLHVFQNIIPVEALTREAAMISALTLQRLTNEKGGEFYGCAATWSMRLKRQLGCVLLHRACQVVYASQAVVCD